MNETENRLWDQVVRTFEILGAPIDVVATYGSKGDTLSDEEILELMTNWNDMHSHTTGDN